MRDQEWHSEHEVTDFVGNMSYFEHQDEDENYVLFSSCEFGSEFYENAGEPDIREAHRLEKLINEYFPEYEIEIDTCGKWTEINLTKKTSHNKLER